MYVELLYNRQNEFGMPTKLIEEIAIRSHKLEAR